MVFLIDIVFHPHFNFFKTYAIDISEHTFLLILPDISFIWNHHIKLSCPFSKFNLFYRPNKYSSMELL
jgi:hypothetical protein